MADEMDELMQSETFVWDEGDTAVRVVRALDGPYRAVELMHGGIVVFAADETTFGPEFDGNVLPERDTLIRALHAFIAHL